MSCMWYAIEGHDGNDVLARRRQARPEHLARLAALRDAGRLLLAGPCPAIDAVHPGPAGFSGSIVVARFESLEEAKTLAADDPYAAGGISEVRRVGNEMVSTVSTRRYIDTQITSKKQEEQNASQNINK